MRPLLRGAACRERAQVSRRQGIRTNVGFVLISAQTGVTMCGNSHGWCGGFVNFDRNNSRIAIDPHFLAGVGVKVKMTTDATQRMRCVRVL
jgi:hypothetical protein